MKGSHTFVFFFLFSELDDEGDQRRACLRQAVFHFEGHDRMDGPLHQPVRFQRAERSGEHAGGNVRYQSAQFVETQDFFSLNTNMTSNAHLLPKRAMTLRTGHISIMAFFSSFFLMTL